MMTTSAHDSRPRGAAEPGGEKFLKGQPLRRRSFVLSVHALARSNTEDPCTDAYTCLYVYLYTIVSVNGFGKSSSPGLCTNGVQIQDAYTETTPGNRLGEDGKENTSNYSFCPLGEAKKSACRAENHFSEIYRRSNRLRIVPRKTIENNIIIIIIKQMFFTFEYLVRTLCQRQKVSRLVSRKLKYFYGFRFFQTFRFSSVLRSPRRADDVHRITR